MPIEFPGIAATDDGSETTPRSGPSFDRDHTVRLGRVHEPVDRDGEHYRFADLVSDTFPVGDAIDVGRHVIPLVREEVAKRDAAAGTKVAR